MNSDYILLSENLVCLFVLLDANLPLQKVDHAFINWLGEHQIPFAIVFTKSDRSKPAKIQKNIQNIKNELLQDWAELPRCFVTSSAKIGRASCRESVYISAVTECLIEHI